MQIADLSIDILNYTGYAGSPCSPICRRWQSAMIAAQNDGGRAMPTREWWKQLQSSLIGVRPGVSRRALFMIAVFTAALATLSQVVSLEQVTIVYLIPVMVAATRWGVVPAVITALAAIAVSAFFFYPPIYDFRVDKIEHIADLVLFVLVAVVTGRLATTAREAEMRAEAEALREAMIGAVSHELRTPLSSIVGAVSVLAAHPKLPNTCGFRRW